MSEPAVHVLLLSGGSGSRMQSALPKQFLEISKKSILAWSIGRFTGIPGISSIHLVAHPDYIEDSRKILEQEIASTRLESGFHVVRGGASRHGSTLAGIDSIKRFASLDDLVLIHDAARPVVTPQEVEALLKGIQGGARVASLASRISDTIVEADSLPGTVIRKLDRSTLFAIKTPQGATLETLLYLESFPEEKGFTDLLTWAERGNISGELVESSPFNQKVTLPSDIPLFEFYLNVTGMKSTSDGEGL